MPPENGRLKYVHKLPENVVNKRAFAAPNYRKPPGSNANAA